MTPKKPIKSLKKGISSKKAESVKGGLNKYAAWGKEPTPARPAGLGAITRQGFNG